VSRLSVVIPNYNGAALLPACLDSLRAQTRPADEIIVVDDASSDASPTLLRETYPEVTLLAMTANRGFCRASNAGLKAAGGDLVMLLNNDTEVEPHCLEELVGAMESDPQAGFCAAKMLFYDRRTTINSVGLFLRRDGVGRDIGYGEPDGPAFAAPRAVFGASAGAALYRQSLLEDTGLLDEDLYAYAEDLDLSFRARLRGWSCLYVPTAVVYHRMGATFGVDSPTKVYYSSRNMLTVLLKDMPTPLLWRYWPWLLAAQLYQVVYFMRRGRGRAVLRGKLHALRDISRTLAKRRVIQRTACVSPGRIAAILTLDSRKSRLTTRTTGRWRHVHDGCR